MEEAVLGQEYKANTFQHSGGHCHVSDVQEQNVHVDVKEEVLGMESSNQET